jgi:hypothetical protein
MYRLYGIRWFVTCKTLNGRRNSASCEILAFEIQLEPQQQICHVAVEVAHENAQRH